METIDNHITVYITVDGAEKKLTEFDSLIGLEKGTYGLRIWRGGKFAQAFSRRDNTMVSAFGVEEKLSLLII